MPAKKSTAKKAPAKKTTAKKAPAKKAPAVEAPKTLYRGGEVLSIAMANRPEGYVEVAYVSAGSVRETVILSPAEFASEFGFDVPEEIK